MQLSTHISVFPCRGSRLALVSWPLAQSAAKVIVWENTSLQLHGTSAERPAGLVELDLDSICAVAPAKEQCITGRQAPTGEDREQSVLSFSSIGCWGVPVAGRTQVTSPGACIPIPLLLTFQGLSCWLHKHWNLYLSVCKQPGICNPHLTRLMSLSRTEIAVGLRHECYTDCWHDNKLKTYNTFCCTEIVQFLLVIGQK